MLFSSRIKFIKGVGCKAKGCLLDPRNLYYVTLYLAELFVVCARGKVFFTCGKSKTLSKQKGTKKAFEEVIRILEATLETTTLEYLQ